MVKGFIGLIVGLFFGVSCYAAPIRTEVIADTRLDDSPTIATSSSLYIQDYDKVGIFVNYAETDVGLSESITVTVDVSYDGTSWVDASFYDFAGGTTAQTSENITANSTYYCWLDAGVNVPEMRVILTASNSNAVATCNVSAYVVGQK